MTDVQKEILKLFERPFQKPPRGDGRPITEGSSGPQLSLSKLVPRGNVFSIFLDSHRLAAKELCDYFMEARNASELIQKAQEVRYVVNEKLFIFALSFVILRKKQEIGRVRLPSIVEVFPNLFVPATIISQLQENAKEAAPDEEVEKIEYGPEFSGLLTKPEHRVSYWREDYGINSHHWHWHLVYPPSMDLKRDRKGELFYYMHQQMLARYDMERLSVGLFRVEGLNNWRIPIPDGYFSKLNINNSSLAWGSRQDNTLLQDYRRGGYGLSRTNISDLELWENRIMDVIHQGFIVDREGKHTILSDDVKPPQKRGIDLLSGAVEADGDISPNKPFYGNLHNMGHNVISASHDPDSAHKENLGVMSENATAVRDPVFFRWHKYIDDLFQTYKLTQLPYTWDEMSFTSVEVLSVEVQSQGKKNQLTTGLNTREFEASRGLDFSSEKPVIMCLTHLDHHPFFYSIEVLNNDDSLPRDVTVRIFLAPKHNERGLEMNFMEQRSFWAEMDRFTYNLKPGTNHIVRDSTSSSVTNDNDFTFRELEERENPNDPDDPENFCGCGWPRHMLLPRGKKEGMPFELFVMVTDWNEDKVEQPPGSSPCSGASSFCGIRDGLYPDARSMGFPFDRRPNRFVEKTSDLTQLSNIAMQDLTITFTNKQITKNN